MAKKTVQIDGVETPAGERVVADFSLSSPAFPVYLGKVNYSRAHKPLLKHVHEGRMEFVHVVKGRQHYRVGGAEYEVRSGELFFTHAGEPHDTSFHPEDKSLFYYLIIDAGALCRGCLGYDGVEGERMLEALDAMQNRVFRARTDTKRLLDGMLACASPGAPFRATTLRNLLSSFLLGVIECEKKGGVREPPPMGGVTGYIERNLCADISLSELAAIAGLSLPRFKSSFRSQTGIPPREYILRRKIEWAKELLAQTDESVTDIAYRLHFSSSQYFATVFKRYSFATPGQYRERERNP